MKQFVRRTGIVLGVGGLGYMALIVLVAIINDISQGKTSADFPSPLATLFGIEGLDGISMLLGFWGVGVATMFEEENTLFKNVIAVMAAACLAVFAMSPTPAFARPFASVLLLLYVVVAVGFFWPRKA